MIQDYIGEDVTNNYLLPFLSKYVVNRNGKLITRIQDIETRFAKLSEIIVKAAAYLRNPKNVYYLWKQIFLTNSFIKNTSNGPVKCTVMYTIEKNVYTMEFNVRLTKELFYTRETILENGEKVLKPYNIYIECSKMYFDNNYNIVRVKRGEQIRGIYDVPLLPFPPIKANKKDYKKANNQDNNKAYKKANNKAYKKANIRLLHYV